MVNKKSIPIWKRKANHWKFLPGFSLLELLVVFSLIGILTISGMASFFSFNRNQTFNVSVENVEQTLVLARSRAISQVKPSVCGTNKLRGYQVSLAGQIYRLRVACAPSNGTYIIQSYNLPSNVAFAPGTIFVNFAISTGAVTPSPQNIVIQGYGKTKTVTVDGTGSISVQ
jgi:type II secretory pathway pseudopilin PulG